MSKEYSHYYIKLNVDSLCNLNVEIKNTNTNKMIFHDSAYSFEHLFEAYKEAKDEFLKSKWLKEFLNKLK